MHNRDEETRLFTPGFILASLATFTLFVSFSPLLATLPIYAIQMGAGEIEVGLIIGAFATTAVFFRQLTGRETDRRGAKGLMLVGALIFLVAAPRPCAGARSMVRAIRVGWTAAKPTP